MLRVYRHHAVDWCADSINAEHLILGRVVWFGFYQPLGCQFLIQCAAQRVFEFTFKCAVAFFGDFTGNAILQYADAEGVKLGGIRFEKYRYHIEHHLGVTDIPCMPPVNENVFSPGYRIGKPFPPTVSFFGSVFL